MGRMMGVFGFGLFGLGGGGIAATNGWKTVI